MSDLLFTAGEFAGRCLSLAKNYDTAYALGMWGWKLTRDGIDAKAKQLPDFYTAAKKRELYALADLGGYWGFDCVCMIKALLWGWEGNSSLPRGGAVYASNGVPDFGANAIGGYCSGFTSDFDGIEAGEALWMPGHVGVYVGGGLAVECTAAWEGRVLITAVGNLGTKAGYHTRTWHKHGKLKWINYEEKENGGMTDKEKEELDKLTKRLGELEKKNSELTGRIGELEKKNSELTGRIGELEKKTAVLEKSSAEYSVPLRVYHYWKEIRSELPWAYKPLRALYDAGLFKGESSKDLRVCRVKIECLVALAAALKKIGEIEY